MKYTKAFAEVVVFNNADVVTASIGPNTPVSELASLPDEQLRKLLGSVYIDDDVLNALRNFFVGDAVHDVIEQDMTLQQAQDYIQSVHDSCNGFFTATAQLYTGEEEDDSFDSEW